MALHQPGPLLLEASVLMYQQFCQWFIFVALNQVIFECRTAEHLPMIIWFFSFSTDNTVIEHFPCLGKALNRYYKGDTVVVYPGRYMLDKAYYLADSLHIVGKGNSSEIVGKSMGTSLFTVYMYI